jgi:hypothetical protein
MAGCGVGTIGGTGGRGEGLAGRGTSFGDGEGLGLGEGLGDGEGLGGEYLGPA